MYYNPQTLDFISDTFSQILTQYLTSLQPTFPNANSPDDPVYVISYVAATQDNLNQNALQVLANAVNGNTAGGIGQDILYSTINNLLRKPQEPSSAAVTITVGPIYSTMTIQVSVSAVDVSPPYDIPTGWQVSSTTVTPSAPYTYTGTPISINAPGVYYVTVTSTDTSTPVPAFAIDGWDPIVGLTFTATNPASANLGSITIPTTWYVTASSIENSPKYYPNTARTISNPGEYTFNVYSEDISVQIYAYQLNTMSDDFGGIIQNVVNKLDGLQGTPKETDAQFAERRRYYSTIEGQSYGGLKKAIADLNVPGLQGVVVSEQISDSYNQSFSIVRITTNYTGSPIIIPVGWEVFGAVVPTSPYVTNQLYTYTSSGDFYIPVYSNDGTTSIPIGNWTSADPPFGTDITAVTNLDPAILNPTLGLGQRGSKVFLNYPTVPYSYCDVVLTVTAVGPSVPYYVPVGWEATGPVTTAPYTTTESYAISATGNYTIRVYSTDITTAITPGEFTGGDAIPGLTFTVTNSSAAVLGQTNPGQFDTNDVYLQAIAQVCADYVVMGTQFYAGGDGATLFQRPTSLGYIQDVILTPYQKLDVSCDLQLVYNLDPSDAGSSTGIFDVSLLPTLQTQIQTLINSYFLGKSSNTYVFYTVKEIEQLIVATYTGIVALVGNSTQYFSLGTLSPLQTGLIYLKQIDGYYFKLDAVNFNFTAINKDVFVP